MDPLTGLIIAGFLAHLVTRTLFSGVTDAIAKAKGDTPPSLEKWRDRQKKREARGEAPEKEPGAWRRRWRMAAERSAAKAAQKHQARMEHLRDNGRANVDAEKDRLRKRAERRQKVQDTLAGWADGTKNKIKDWHDENQAWQRNKDRTADPDATTEPEPAAAPADQVLDGPDAEVLPFRLRGDSDPAEPGNPAAEPFDPPVTDWGFDPFDLDDPDLPQKLRDLAQIYRAHGNEEGAARLEEIADNHDRSRANNSPTDTHGGTDPMAPTNTATEITNLETAISFSIETAKYTETVGATLTDLLEQVTQAAQGLAAEAAQYETGKANLSDKGFGSKVTSRFDVGAEALNLAAEALRQSMDKITQASEQATAAAGEMRESKKVFEEQLGLSEQVGAARGSAGVAKETEFYG